MRVSFLALARALTILPLLFVPVAFSQTDDCRIIDGGSVVHSVSSQSRGVFFGWHLWD
jgi:hypothetical protein